MKGSGFKKNWAEIWGSYFFSGTRSLEIYDREIGKFRLQQGDQLRRTNNRQNREIERSIILDGITGLQNYLQKKKNYCTEVCLFLLYPARKQELRYCL